MKFLCFFFTLVWIGSIPLHGDSEEELCLRRLQACHKEHDYQTAQQQAEEFFTTFPQSKKHYLVYETLGDLAIHAGKLDEALEWYSCVDFTQGAQSVFQKRWKLLYQLRRFDQLHEETSSESLALLNKETEVELHRRFYLAESCLYYAIDATNAPQKISRSEWMEKAQTHYKSLLDHPQFSARAHFAIAECQRAVGHESAAIENYQDVLSILFTKVPNEIDQEMLLTSLRALYVLDNRLGLEKYEEFSKKKGTYQTPLTLEWQSKLIEMKKWDKLIEQSSFFINQLANSTQLANNYYWLGYAAAQKEKHKLAHEFLLKALENHVSPPLDQKAVFIALQEAYLEEDSAAFEEIDFRYAFLMNRNSKEFQRTQILKALLKEKKGHFEEALSLLNKIEGEEAEREKIRLLLLCKKHDSAHQICQDMLALNPQNVQWARQLVEVSLEKVSVKKDDSAASTLAKDLEYLLPLIPKVNTEESSALKILLAKAYLASNQRESAFKVLSELVETSPGSFEVHRLMALYYELVGQNPKSLIHHAEEAIRLNPLHTESVALHLTLFNTYLMLAEEFNEGRWFRRAAEHLYEIRHTQPLSLSQQIWLAKQFVYYSFSNHLKDAQRAVELLRPLLENEEHWLQHEQDLLELCDLYQQIGQKQEAQYLLEQLLKKQRNESTLPWKNYDLTLLRYAQLLVEEKEKQPEAFSLFQKLEDSSQPFVAQQSMLESARLLYQQFFLKNHNSSLLEDIKSRYTTLKLHRHLKNEPLHLEAAIELAELEASLEKTENQQEALLKNYLTLFQDFSSREGIWSKDYHAARQDLPAKDLTYQAYMRYVEGTIYLLQAKEAAQRGNEREKRSKESAAKALFSTLCEGRYAVTPYLIKRAREGLQK